MNSTITRNLLRAIFLILLQVLLFKRIAIESDVFVYISVFVYPIFLILLPVKTPQSLAILLGFVFGLIIDAFYMTIGVHAAACVFTAFVRYYLLRFLTPRTGYALNQNPTKRSLGLQWFLTYASVLLLLHLLFYFSVEAFSFVYLGDIILRTVFSFFVSMVFIIVYQFIFDPE